MLTWGIFWNNTEYYPKGYWENGIHSFVFWFSLINFVIKVKEEFDLNNGFLDSDNIPDL